MRFVVCLHGASVARSALPLHPTDERAIVMGVAAGADILVLEAVGQRGTAPRAVGDAIAAGATRAIRLVEPALASTDAQATGFVFATAIDQLDVDLVLFGGDADPDGLGDVPASIAHHMTALYLPEAIDFGPARPGAATIEVVFRGADCLRRLEISLNAVVGIARGPWRQESSLAGAAGAPKEAAAASHSSVRVLTLADFNIDAALVRRRDDRRGVIESTSRPLVTLQSAAAVAALLRRT